LLELQFGGVKKCKYIIDNMVIFVAIKILFKIRFSNSTITD